MNLDINSKSFRIDWSSRSKLRGPGEKSLGNLIRQLRNRLAPEAEGISITYLDNRAMRKLNRDYRGINQSTDVLSFPANPEKGTLQYLGDIVISLPMAEKIARKLRVSRRREIETLIIHGFLHLCMHDHDSDNGEMMILQAELERDLLDSEPLLMFIKRGRKFGSKIKILKNGSRIVVTGRAANAIIQREVIQKSNNRDLVYTINENEKIHIKSSANSKHTIGMIIPQQRRSIRRRMVSNRFCSGILS